MSFRLIVIPPKDGDPYPANDAPLPNRYATGAAALRALHAEGVNFRYGGLRFAESVATAAVGAVITHEESGYSFRVEEIPS